MKRKYLIVSLIVLIVVVVDQLSKIIISNAIPLTNSVEVIKNFFYLTYNINYGAAFGIFNGRQLFLIIIAFLMLGYLIYEIIKNVKKKSFLIAYSVIIGGLIGNLIDRILFGYVRDFMDFHLFNMNMAIFNISDACLVVGVCFLLILLIKEEKSEIKNK